MISVKRTGTSTDVLDSLVVGVLTRLVTLRPKPLIYGSRESKVTVQLKLFTQKVTEGLN